MAEGASGRPAVSAQASAPPAPRRSSPASTPAPRRPRRAMVGRGRAPESRRGGGAAASPRVRGGASTAAVLAPTSVAVPPGSSFRAGPSPPNPANERSSPASPKARRTSAMRASQDGKRDAGSFASARATIASRSPGSSGRRFVTDGAGA